MSNPAGIVELRIPKLLRGYVILVLLSAFLGFFTAVAIYNLLHGVMIVISIFWLILVAAGIRSSYKEAGSLGRWMLNIRGGLAPRHFVESVSGGTRPAEVGFGYEWFGGRHIYLRVPVEKIETVEWHPGQATAMTGRDCKDWHVALWYDHDDPDRRKIPSVKPDQDIYIVGPSQRRERTETFGLRLVEFLRNAGADLVPGKDECTFVRRAADAEKLAAT